MSSQELPQAQRDVEMQQVDAAPQEDAIQQEGITSTTTSSKMEEAGTRTGQADNIATAAETKDVPFSEPAVPSSDAVLPSSPSPVKQLLETAKDTNTPEPTSKKRPADDIDSIAHATATEASSSMADQSNDVPSTTTNDPNPPPAEPPNPALAPLQTKLSNLRTHLTTLQNQHTTAITTSTLPSGLPLPETWTPAQKQTAALQTANAVIKEHIALLHSYNEIKDVGMGLMGLVAEKRGCRVKEVMGEFGVGEKD
ncbi:hypothetical protein PRZ48_007004 [Zasmidium cellare]|uniref:Swi5-domain-containing protein n=1 Tax=Zasmidium cellare TaxID=395010 RepID=A0ABR0EI52_ZASCE|nr:hypothetical protein PRZ48_007004 [Zasmidium cellare]